MMSDHNFGKPKNIKPMQLVNPNVASALSLQKLNKNQEPKNIATTPSDRPPSVTPITPTNVATIPSNRPSYVTSPVAPMRLVESMRQTSPPPPLPPPPPPPPVHEEHDDSPPCFTISDDINDSDGNASLDDCVNWSEWDDGFGFLDTSQFQNAAAELSLIADATTTTPVVESSEPDSSASTIRLDRSKRTLTVVPNVAEIAIDSQDAVLPHNSEADLGAPGNLIGVKRAKRIRALERETEIVKRAVEKLQRTHDAVLSQCLAAAKSEAREQLLELHDHWCQLMGFDVSNMSPLAIESRLQRFDNFRRHEDEQEHELGLQIGAGDEDWIADDLFEGEHLR
jgi:hypothetical protein